MVVHEQGARHLVDPSRLVDSAGRVYGELLDTLYGRMLPVPQERILAATDGQRIDLGGGHQLTLVELPGHAKHHQAVLDESLRHPAGRRLGLGAAPRGAFAPPRCV